MRNIMLSCTALAALAIAGLATGDAAIAAPAKVWVSSFGTDSGTCGAITAQCRTFQQAHDNVASGGEIGVSTAGDYVPLTINQSINITNDGAGEAGVQVSAGHSGLTISALAGDMVSLHGLTIDGQGIGAQGIRITTASAVHIQNCVIRNFEASPGNGVGIFLSPGGNTQMFVSDTIIFNNGSTATTGGIVIEPTGTGSANVVLDRVHLENNVRGLWADGSLSTGNGVHVILRDSVSSGNAGDGILATSASGKAPAFVVVDRSTTANNAGAGIAANGPRAVVLLRDSFITRNGSGVSTVNGGQLISYANNANNNNLGAEGVATGTFAPF